MMSTPASSSGAVRKVLLGCTGSVAAVRIPVIIQQLQELDIQVEVRVVSTENALHFFNHTELGVTLYRDHDEWQTWRKMNDPVLHIELRRWADIMVIAPLDCNTLAKIAHGICDNLLTCIVRAWDLKKPLLFAPAMNTAMLEHPLTAQQYGVLQSFGYTMIPTVTKTLACGDKGDGAMAEVSTIIDMIQNSLQT